MSGKKGQTWSKPMTQQQRDSISLTKIEQFLDNQIDDENPSIDKLQAIKIRYDKLRPSLSAVEQTNVNENDSLTEDQIIVKLQQVIAANPALVSKLLADHAKTAPGVRSAPDAPADCGETAKSAAHHADNAQSVVNGAS